MVSKGVRLEVSTKKTKCIFSTETGESCIMKASLFVAPHSSHQTKELRWTGHLAYAGKKKGV